jgi:ATP-dependent DNA helicase RecG
MELWIKAEHPEPEFGEQAGSVSMRFLPSDYIAPHRIAHDLTGRQREILHVLSGKPSLPLREIRTRMDNPPSDRRLREELLNLKKLGLVSSSGHGRGAAWSLVRHENE